MNTPQHLYIQLITCPNSQKQSQRQIRRNDITHIITHYSCIYSIYCTYSAVSWSRLTRPRPRTALCGGEAAFLLPPARNPPDPSSSCRTQNTASRGWLPHRYSFRQLALLYIMCTALSTGRKECVLGGGRDCCPHKMDHE